MANPFDQFDPPQQRGLPRTVPAPGGNPFDQFDTPQPSPPAQRANTINDFQNGTGAFAPEPLLPGAPPKAEPHLSAQYVAQQGSGSAADFLGIPVDLAAAGLNIGAFGADKAAQLFGGSFPYRFEKPFMGSEWLADTASKAYEAAGGHTISGDEVPPEARMAGAALRSAAAAVLPGMGLASKGVQTLVKGGGRIADLLRPYASAYSDSRRALAGDAIAGAGTGVAAQGYDEYMPQDVQESVAGPFVKMAAALLGGATAAGTHAAALGVKDLAVNKGRNIIFGKSDPAAPMYEGARRPFTRPEMDTAARVVQEQASNPKEAAAKIREGAKDIRSFASDEALPTSGALSGDVGLALLEREARARVPKPFLERDRATNTRAGELAASVAPPGADPRAFTDAANDIQRGRVQAAQANLDAARARQEQLAGDMRNRAAPIAAGAGQKVPASQNLDSLVVDQSLFPMQSRKNEAFAAVDPHRTVVRDAKPLIESAQEIRDSLGRLNDPGSVLPTRTLDRIAALSPDAGGAGTITYGELNALRPELAAGLVKARAAGDFALADNIQSLQRALNRETERLAREASPAGQRAAAAQRIYSEEFSPVWNTGPGDEATRFRRDVNADRAGRTQSPPSATAGRFLRPGQPEKAESLRRIVASMPDQAAAQREIRRFLVGDLAESGVIDSAHGNLRPDALRRWLDQWGSGLDTAPGFRDEIKDMLRHADIDALQSGRLAREIKAAEAGVDDAIKNRGALGLVLGKDPVRAVAGVFNSGDPKTAMRDLVKEMGTNKRASAGLKAAVVDYLTQRVSTPAVQKTANASRPLDFDKLENLFNSNQDALAGVFSPEEMNTLRQAHKMLKPQKEIQQPGTPPSLYEAKKLERAWNLLEGGLKARYGVLKGGSVLRTIRIFIATLPNKDQAVRDLVVKMHFDPDLAVHLLGRNVKVDTPSWNAKLNQLLSASIGAQESLEPRPGSDPGNNPW